MKLRELMTFIETVASKDLAEEWDNVGLLYGDPEKDIQTVVVALDADAYTIAFAKEQGAQAIVTHHPIIFSPVRAITAPSALYDAVTNGIACFAAHTNLDAAKGGVNDALAETIGLQNVREAFGGRGRIGELPYEAAPVDFVKHVGDALHTAVQYKAGDCAVRTVALVSGSGGDFAAEAQADAFLTGEMKHHEWLALPLSTTVAVAGHYATEAVIVEPLAAKIQNAFPSLRVLPHIGQAPYATC